MVEPSVVYAGSDLLGDVGGQSQQDGGDDTESYWASNRISSCLSTFRRIATKIRGF